MTDFLSSVHQLTLGNPRTLYTLFCYRMTGILFSPVRIDGPIRSRPRLPFMIRSILRNSITVVLLFSMGASSGLSAQSLDEAFLAARDAYNVQDFKKLDTLAAKLSDHPLAIYIDYWRLSARITDAAPDDVRSFITNNSDTPLAERLRMEWLKELGRRGDWEVFNTEFPKLVNADAEITCYALQAKLVQHAPDVAKEARSIWFSQKTSPDSCTPVFDKMIASGAIDADDVWQRIRMALEVNNVTLAKQINEYLPAKTGIDEKAISLAASEPQRYLDRGKRQLHGRAAREATLFALLRLARTQSSLAAEYLTEISNRLPAKDLGYAWGQIAHYGAINHESSALRWYAKAGDASLNDTQRAWQVRAALRARDWPEVLESIGRLSPTEQQESSWRYWKARALKAMEKTAEANDILVPLSRQTHFYGLLAGEELGPMLTNPTALWKPNEQEVAGIRQVPGIQRALHLNRLQMAVEALREWSMATRGLDDRQLLSAAEAASRVGWIDRAISTADRTRELHDYSLRFPTPFRDSLTMNARKHQLDEAWVYGIIRQESRFVTEARSRSGALGLMQLMPSTARWVAHRLGIKNLRETQITDVNTNIALGTFYMRNVLDSLGHPVLATAGYNAGPGRARRWRAENALEGAIYTETIPITETRDYVKKVMANATLYALQLGLTPRPLKDRLGVIPGLNTSIEVSNTDVGPGG